MVNEEAKELFQRIMKRIVPLYVAEGWKQIKTKISDDKIDCKFVWKCYNILCCSEVRPG